MIKMYDARRPKDYYNINKHINKQMDQDTYQLRRKVMNIIYRANDLLKKEFGKKMNRIDVRITNRTVSEVLGTAKMGDYAIWIPEETIVMGEETLNWVVYHELLHAAFNMDHVNKKGHLMYPYIKLGIPIEWIEEAFIDTIKFYDLENWLI